LLNSSKTSTPAVLSDFFRLILLFVGHKTGIRRMEGRIYISVVIGDACSHRRICSPDRCFVDTSFGSVGAAAAILVANPCKIRPGQCKKRPKIHRFPNF